VTATGRGPIRIAYVLPYLVAGGTEGHVLSLLRRIDRRRFSPIVIALGGGGELEHAFRKEGVPLHMLGRDGLTPRPGRMARTLRDALGSVRSLSGILRRERPDILHAYLPAANVIGAIAARLSGVPRVIVSKRALAEYKAAHPRLRRVEPLGNLMADVVLVNSDAVRRDVERTERHWAGKFRKIYNGVAPIPPWTTEEKEAFRRREGIPIDARVVLCVSNFYPYKGHDELVEAAARIVPAFPKVIFLMVGRDSGTMEATKARVRERNIEGSVRFAGGRTDVPDLLRASDLFVHPSREEGFSNAILEAMAARLPVVACDVGGNPEAVVDVETGRLVPPLDPERFADAMGELIADESKGKSFGEAGLRRASERFPLDRMVGEMESLYESLARGGR